MGEKLIMITKNEKRTKGKLILVVLALLCFKPVITGYSTNQASDKELALDGKDRDTLPEFDDKVSKNLRVGVGQTVYLPCTVRNLGDKLVSWIRTKDLHILTHGIHTFTADQRFDVLHSPSTETWTLKIKKSKPSDSGRYECQVNTDPKIMLAFNVTIKDTLLKDSPFIPETYSTPLKATISGPREQYVKVGSTVAFSCELSWTVDGKFARPSKQKESNVSAPRWLHNKLAISFQADRGGISVEAERSSKSSNSRLTVAGVTLQDGGQYTCVGDDTTPDTVTLVVVEGEHVEAMQRDRAANSGAWRSYRKRCRNRSNVFYTHVCLILNLVDFAPCFIAAVLSWLICIYNTKWRWGT